MNLKAQFLGILFIVICSFSFAQPETNPDTLQTQGGENSQYTDSIQRTFNFPTFEFPADSVKQKEKLDPEIEAMMSFAKTFLGTPYRYGGTTPSGFDCSGFIMYIMGNFGFTIGRTSVSMSEVGRTIKISEARPGDLMFFKGRNANSSSVGHVGMVYEVKDDGVYIIHASTSRGVVIENFSKSRYLIPRYLKVKRLDYGKM